MMEECMIVRDKLGGIHIQLRVTPKAIIHAKWVWRAIPSEMQEDLL